MSSEYPPYQHTESSQRSRRSFVPQGASKAQKHSFSLISRTGIILGENVNSAKLYLIKFYRKKVSCKIFLQLKTTPSERAEVRTKDPKNHFLSNISHRNHFRAKYQEAKIVPHQILQKRKVTCKIFVQLKITPQERAQVHTLCAGSFCVLKLKRR